jgi:hypothetical protein
MISQYWKDQIPAKPLSIQVKDSGGLDYDLSDYDTIEVRMLGTDNEEISLTGSSVIKNTGDYVLQLKLGGTGRLDFTTTHTIRVRELGRIR